LSPPALGFTLALPSNLPRARLERASRHRHLTRWGQQYVAVATGRALARFPVNDDKSGARRGLHCARARGAL